MTATGSFDLRPAGGRYHTSLPWLESWHSFSFGNHQDPANTGHGLLLVSNDDVVAPSGGFGTHGHSDMEIFTWVLSGELEHRDSAGNEGVIYPGLAQRMSAGRGIRHSEINHSATEPVHFIQMWVPPGQSGIEPGYEQRDLNEALAAGGLVAVASGQGHDGAVHIHQKGAVLWVARLDPGATVAIPDAPFVHAFVASGQVEIAGAELSTGDAVRLASAGAGSLTASTAVEVLIWATEDRV